MSDLKLAAVYKTVTWVFICAHIVENFFLEFRLLIYFLMFIIDTYRTRECFISSVQAFTT